jgi:hypothetical protein
MGAESLEAATVLHNIAGTLHAAGEFVQTEAPAHSAWEISCARLGDEHPQALADAAVYAAVLDGLARHEEAEAFMLTRLYERYQLRETVLETA